jgi:GTP pyrophosphokinase
MTIIKENKESFFRRLRGVCCPSEMLDIELCYMITKYGHRDQKRKELDEEGNQVRYFEHPRRVAIILMDECKIYEPAMVKACLGHDVKEDTEISDHLIEKIYGPEATRIIIQLTKEPGEGDAYYERLKERADWKSMLVKLCDRLDNTRSLGDCTPEFQQKQVLDTTNHIYPVVGELILKAPGSEIRNIANETGRKIREQVEIIQQGLK